MRAQSHLTGQFSARASLNSKHWLLLITVCAVLWSSQMQADDRRGAFLIKQADVEPGETAWVLHAWFDIKLSSAAREALENGVPLVFEFQVQALEEQPWLWDRVIGEQRQAREVQLHPLSRTYVVKNLNSGEQRSFRRLDEAMQSVGVLLNIDVLDYAAALDSRNYSVRLRGSLDIESLPTSIRLLAYVSPAWAMKSEWYQWPLEK